MASKNSGRKQTPAGGAGTSRREALRQAQAEQAAHQKRVRLILIVACAVVVVALVVVAVLGATGRLNPGRDQSTGATSLGEQITPPHANADGTGIVSPLNTSDSAPTLVIYEDYQCPICQTYEELLGPSFASLAESGQIRIEYRTRIFLDRNLEKINEANGNPESSKRAAMAAVCADQVGKFQEYHDAAYAAAPENEGDGYSEQQLREEIPSTAGITGDDLTTFLDCLDENRAQDFVESVEQAGMDAGVTSTPTFLVNGNPVSFQNVDYNSEESVLEAILAAA